MVASDWLSQVTCLHCNCKGGWESEVWFLREQEEGSASLGDSQGRGRSKQMLESHGKDKGALCWVRYHLLSVAACPVLHSQHEENALK